jgi:peptidoglycan/xylan/chitin deacetylase (PgdA/CDA1 family)
MSFYWIKTNALIKRVFSKYIWDIPNKENKIYLTFDDGPTPKVTEWVLNELQKHNAKATFFCIGKNIKKYPGIFKKITNDGHSIGNHTFNHRNGWKTTTKDYLENIKLCDSTIKNQKSKLFRPPYGKIKPKQSYRLRKMGYAIIMWDILSADFDQTITPQHCLDNVLRNVKSGSIIVFHDSQKAFRNLEYILPRVLEELKSKAFTFDLIQ